MPVGMFSSTIAVSEMSSRYFTRARRLLPCAAMTTCLPARTDGALEHGSVGEIERVAALAQKPARFFGLRAATLGQIYIGPPGEPVLAVPGTLPVSKQNNFMHGARWS